MKVLLTGASGFLGKSILEAFSREATTETLGRSSSHTFPCDLTKGPAGLDQSYDIVIHNAGKAHSVPKTDKESRAFFQVNTEGTENLIRSFEHLPRHLVFISTVAVYGEAPGLQFKENDPLKGDTPYAKSKIQAEQLLSDWARKNRVKLTILRLPLVIGANPPGNLGAMINAIRKGFYFRVGPGEGRRSMVLAQDVSNLIKSGKLKDGIYNLTDGYHPKFNEIDQAIASRLGKKIRKIPRALLSPVAKVGDLLPGFPLTTYRLKKLTSDLTVNDAKARDDLGWNGRAILDHVDDWLPA